MSIQLFQSLHTSKFKLLSLWGFLVLFIWKTVFFPGEVKSTSFKRMREEIPTYFKLSVDANTHNDYGLNYPVTYQFSIPSGSSNLKAYKKYTKDGIWAQINEKSSLNFFNGIEAVRFDYANNKAYISVAFNEMSDNIFLKVTDEFENPVAVYDKITKYYDNRKAAVVFSADDWDGNSTVDSKFQEACDMFASKKIWLSVGVITKHQSPPIWSHIQSKIDKGYIEVDSHSRTHPRLPYNDYDSEIRGSKEDIIENLDLPTLYKKGLQEYVWGWIAPYSYSNASIRSELGKCKYISDVCDPYAVRNGDFPDWDAVNGLYKQWNRWSFVECKPLRKLNSEFDERINRGKIYHLGFHPAQLNFTPGSKIDQHTDHLKGRKDLWYAGSGALMVYHYMEDQDIITIKECRKGELLDIFCCPNPCYLAEGQIVKFAKLPSSVEKICIYTIAGELVRSLENGDGLMKNTDTTNAIWNCRNSNGKKVARGVYIYVIISSCGEREKGTIAIIR